MHRNEAEKLLQNARFVIFSERYKIWQWKSSHSDMLAKYHNNDNDDDDDGRYDDDNKDDYNYSMMMTTTTTRAQSCDQAPAGTDRLLNKQTDRWASHPWRGWSSCGADERDEEKIKRTIVNARTSRTDCIALRASLIRIAGSAAAAAAAAAAAVQVRQQNVWRASRCSAISSPSNLPI